MRNILKTCSIALSIILALNSCGKGDTQKTADNIDRYRGSTKKSSVAFSAGKQKIIKLQTKFGRDYINKLDCNAYDAGGKAYCLAEKTGLSKKPDMISWEGVQKKGSEYMIKYDCDLLSAEYDRKLCMDWKKNTDLKDAENIKEESMKFMDMPWDEFGNFDCKTLKMKYYADLCQTRKSNRTKIIGYFNGMPSDNVLSFDCSTLKTNKLDKACESYIKSLKSK